MPCVLGKENSILPRKRVNPELAVKRAFAKKPVAVEFEQPPAPVGEVASVEAEVGSWEDNQAELADVRTKLRTLTDELAGGALTKDQVAQKRLALSLLRERETQARNALKLLHAARLKNLDTVQSVTIRVVEFGRTVSEGEV